MRRPIFSMFGTRLLLILFCLGSFCFTTCAFADDVVAVLSSSLAPYQEALSGFQQAFGAQVPASDLSTSRSRITPSTKIVVTFGARAIEQAYPSHVKLVSCMAPGALISDEQGGKAIRISMTPPASVILSKIAILQPRLHRLGFLWISDNQREFNDEMLAAARDAGIDLISRRLGRADELPDALRALNDRHAEALWIPPDPQLLTSQNFNVVRAFSRSNQIPFYVANEGFVDKGATAAVAAPFREMGRSAAQIALRILAGTFNGANAYPEKVVLVVGEQSAKACGLELTEAIRSKVDKVIP